MKKSKKKSKIFGAPKIHRILKLNKKGYIRTIEAILAIMIVFGFVVTILPKKTTEIAKAPPELDSTMRSVLEEAQNNEEFRTCLLLKDNVKLESGNAKAMVKNSDCLKNQLEKALPAFSPWDYGFAICDGTGTDSCVMYNSTDDDEGNIIKIILPSQKTIYTKSSVMAVPDVVAKPFLVTGGSCCGNFDPITNIATKCGPGNSMECCELNSKLPPTNIVTQMCISKGKTIYLYLWDKM